MPVELDAELLDELEDVPDDELEDLEVPPLKTLSTVVTTLSPSVAVSYKTERTLLSFVHSK